MKYSKYAPTCCVFRADQWKRGMDFVTPNVELTGAARLHRAATEGSEVERHVRLSNDADKFQSRKKGSR